MELQLILQANRTLPCGSYTDWYFTQVNSPPFRQTRSTWLLGSHFSVIIYVKDLMPFFKSHYSTECSDNCFIFSDRGSLGSYKKGVL